MTSEAKDKLLDRIRKLMALSKSPNENEAASAANKAQALLAEHNLSQSELETEDAEDDLTVDGSVVTDSLPWRRRLASSVATLYFCKYFYTYQKKYTVSRTCGYIRYDAHSFIGAPHNIAVAKGMFQYLNDTVERLANDESLRVPVSQRSSFKTSFKTACASRLSSRLYNRYLDAKKGGVVKSETTGTNLPALASMYDRVQNQLQTYMSKKYPKMGGSRKAPAPSNVAGVAAGLAAGDRIGLDPQVGRHNGGAHLLSKRGE